MDYEQLFIDMLDALQGKLNAETVAYDVACRRKGSASYDAAKALGAMRSTQAALNMYTSCVLKQSA